MTMSRIISTLPLAAALALGMAAPAHAGDADAADSAATASTPAASSGKSREVKYCVVGKITGTRLSHKECKTEKEWAKIGYSLEDLTK